MELSGFADYYGHTTLHPVGLFAVIALGVSLLLLPQRHVIYPMILLACFIPSAQRLVVMGLDFTLLRILVLFAWSRLLLRNEFKGFVWNRLDALFVLWMLSGSLILTINHGTASALVNRAGWMFEGCGMYFFFRCALRDWQSLDRLLLGFALVSIPVALAFVIEWQTGRNAFSIFGGVPPITGVRDGRLRCQGAFSHAIMAGCFWAAIVPYIVASIHASRSWLVCFGLACALIIVVTCSSSTPTLSIAFGVVGMTFYIARSHMRVIRWGLGAALVVAHLTMQGPVWSLVAKVNVISGSTGHHRFMVIDATINNFSEWWLLGESDPLSWGEKSMRDITNQYVMEALLGGLLTLSFFILMISVAFGTVGKVLKHLGSDTRREWIVWCAGVALFTHVCAYFGVTYFGQILMLWYLCLAAIGSLPNISGLSNRDVSPTRIVSEIVPRERAQLVFNHRRL